MTDVYRLLWDLLPSDGGTWVLLWELRCWEGQDPLLLGCSVVLQK